MLSTAAAGEIGVGEEEGEGRAAKDAAMTTRQQQEIADFAREPVDVCTKHQAQHPRHEAQAQHPRHTQRAARARTVEGVDHAQLPVRLRVLLVILVPVRRCRPGVHAAAVHVVHREAVAVHQRAQALHRRRVRREAAEPVRRVGHEQRRLWAVDRMVQLRRHARRLAQLHVRVHVPLDVGAHLLRQLRREHQKALFSEELAVPRRQLRLPHDGLRGHVVARRGPPRRVVTFIVHAHFGSVGSSVPLQ